MAEKGSKVNFINFDKQLPVPFVIYADFEAEQKKFRVASQMIKNHIQILINNTKTVHMAITLFAAMIISIQNQYKYTEYLKLYTDLWKNA